MASAIAFFHPVNPVSPVKIRSHCTPEQAIEMARAAGARSLMPVHHQTFRLSFEPFLEPIERFADALQDEPERIALRNIGETFVLEK
jgi:L-ascorbate metabolism protein UlaG (beta-lactamase superfamily)